MALFVIRDADNDLNQALSQLSDLNKLAALCSHPLLRQNSRQRQQTTGKHELVEKSDDFTISVDVQHFAPEEINVKVVDNFLEVEAKHEERPDEHGYISRYFKRKYPLPENYNSENIVSKLSSDGVLTIRAPKIQKGPQERLIPIIQTGGPHRSKEVQKEDVEEKK